MDEYNAVISKYDQLCSDRNNNKFWADNIVEATENIKSALVWQNFYAYIGNVNHKFSNTWKESLGEQIDNGLTMKCDGQEYKTKTVKNGNVTYIQMTPPPDNFNVSIKSNESLDFIPESLPEEKSET